MSNLNRLEDALRADPDNDELADELLAETGDLLGFSAEESAAHVTYIRVMARRARALAQAAELIGEGSPTRPGLLKAALQYVNLESITQAAFHVTTDGEAPTVEDRPRTVAGCERVVVIRTPAEWLIRTAREMVGRQPRRPRRTEGGS